MKKESKEKKTEKDCGSGCCQRKHHPMQDIQAWCELLVGWASKTNDGPRLLANPGILSGSCRVVGRWPQTWIQARHRCTADPGLPRTAVPFPEPAVRTGRGSVHARATADVVADVIARCDMTRATY